jgi:membrane protein DedA with SNARE-associated domain
MGAIHHLGYAAVFLILLLEAVGVPSPDEAALFLAGIAVGRGQMDYLPAVLSSAAGAFLGSIGSYALARRLGRPLLTRYGRRVGMTPERLRSAEAFMARYGPWAAFLGRIVSGLRLVTGYGAGLLGLSPLPFVVASALGALTWSALDVGAGMLLGQRLSQVWGWVHLHGVWAAGVTLAVVLVAVVVWRGRRRRRAHGEPPQTGA